MSKDWRTIYENLVTGNLAPFKIKLLQHISHLRPTDYDSVWENDWDVLLIADACRYDLAEEVMDEHDVEAITSVASSTEEWSRKFPENLEDVVYISANPYVSNVRMEEIYGKNPFYRLYDVWKDGWDSELQTVPPRKLNQKLLEARESHPDKRIVVHYVQPHHPFIGEIRIEEELWNMGFIHTRRRYTFRRLSRFLGWC